MIDRRQFIGAVAGSSVAAALAGATVADGRGEREPILARGEPSGRAAGEQGMRVAAVLFDERFEAARHLGAAMQHRGVTVHSIRGDVTEVWYAHLYPLWREAPAPVAGLTAYAAMFCLEHLAWDHGLRMIDRGVHAADPALYSWLIAPPARRGAYGV